MILMKTLFYGAILLTAFFGYYNISMASTTLKIGDKAPEFNLLDAKGDIVNLANFKCCIRHANIVITKKSSQQYSAIKKCFH